jgi:hypothetical protein
MSRYFLPFLFITLSGIVACKNKKGVSEEPISESVVLSDPLPEAVPQELPSDSLIIYYSRGSCFGTCPVFTLSVYRSGLAIYEGRQFVDKIGRHTGVIAEPEVDAVLSKAAEIGFFTMERRYDNPTVSDLPGTELRLQDNSGKIRDVYARFKYPSSLTELYDLLDKTIENTPWKINDSKQ